jgi:hypothetical protein
MNKIIFLGLLLIILFIVIRSNGNLKENFKNIPKKKNIFDKDLVIDLDGGMCNKIRTLLGFYYLAKINKVKLYALWQNSPECPGYYEDLFRPLENVIIIKEPENIKKLNNVHDLGTLNDFIPWNFGVPASKHFQFYKNLKITDKLKQRILFFINNHLKGRPSLGLHIRRTDLVDYKDKLKIKLQDDEYYQNEITKFLKKNKNGVIYLATDHNNTQSYYKNIYHDKLLFYDVIPLNDNLRKTELSHGLIDIIILSKCSKFIGTDKSSFSHMVEFFKKFHSNIV